MDMESVQPILTGLAGGVMAMLFGAWFSRWLPRDYNGKTREVLLREHKAGILLANAVLVGSLGVGILIYRFGVLANNDLRGIALCLGGASIVIMLALPMVATAKKLAKKEAYVAYAMSNAAPITLIYGILFILILVGAIAGLSFLI